MGNSFTNLHVRSNDRDGVIGALRKTGGLPAYVSKPAAGWISAYPQMTEKPHADVLERVSQLASAALDTAVFGFLVHNSDFFQYVQCDKGELVDRYHSRPDYFEGGTAPPEGGRVQFLLPFCRRETTPRHVQVILHQRMIPRKGASQEMKAQMEAEFEEQKRRLTLGYPQMAKKLKAAGLPVPPLENLLRQMSSVGDKMMGESGDAVVADDLARALAMLLDIPGQRALKGYTQLSQGDPAPGALSSPIIS